MSGQGRFKGGWDSGRPAPDLRSQRGIQTPLSCVAAVLLAEIGRDQYPQLAAPGGGLGSLAQARSRLAKRLGNCFRVQLLLACEMAIKAAMGKAQVPHEVGNGNAFAAVAAEAS